MHGHELKHMYSKRQKHLGHGVDCMYLNNDFHLRSIHRRLAATSVGLADTRSGNSTGRSVRASGSARRRSWREAVGRSTSTGRSEKTVHVSSNV